MNFIVTKTTQKEESVLVEAENLEAALDAFNNNFNFSETKDLQITKITVTPVTPAPAPAEVEVISS